MSVCAEALEKIFEECANVPCAGRSTRPQSIVVSTSSLSTAAALSRSRTRLVPARVPAGRLIATQGKRGAAGERSPPGPKGDAGASGATIRDWKIDRTRYVATPIMSDGSEGPPLELRGLFEQFWLEAR
jgi:hypothetical protein